MWIIFHIARWTNNFSSWLHSAALDALNLLASSCWWTWSLAACIYSCSPQSMLHTAWPLWDTADQTTLLIHSPGLPLHLEFNLNPGTMPVRSGTSLPSSRLSPFAPYNRKIIIISGLWVRLDLQLPDLHLPHFWSFRSQLKGSYFSH